MNQLKALFLFILLACSLNITAQRIKGSDTVLPVSQETAEIFMKDDPDRRVTVTGGGTGVGISALMDNTTDIAMASRPIKFSEKMKLKAAKQEVEEVIIAYDALAVIVNPSNPVSQLTRQQLEAIFRGKITNWKQLGGPDMKIIVYSRETSSGTYEFFKEKRPEEQELHEQQLVHARHRSRDPVCKPDQRRYRLCGTGLLVPPGESHRRFLRRRQALCTAQP